MAFIDTATVLVKAGSGGNGVVNFRREPYVARGGPDGGDGGNGGNVVFVADQNLNSLAHFRHRQRLTAQDGANGARANRHGKNGEDLQVHVPIGTIVYRGKEVVQDFTEAAQSAVVSTGGKGGFGNAHFTSSRRQAPSFAEKGEPGEQVEFTLELKMIADVGLVGLPNAGKSTLLSVVSNARPRIADYPFTTLEPNLGVADIDDGSILIADIPGLIEGASDGKGLGDDFLRHVERTAVLIHLIDAYSNDIAKDYTVIQNELANYSIDLTKRPQIVALTKTEGLDTELVADQIKQLKTVCKKTDILPISAIGHKGLTELLRTAKKAVQQYRDSIVGEAVEDEIPVISLDEQKTWHITMIEPHKYRVIGAKIERFAKRTDFTNDEAIDRLRDIMYKFGVEQELLKLGAAHKDTIYFGQSNVYKISF